MLEIKIMKKMKMIKVSIAKKKNEKKKTNKETSNHKQTNKWIKKHKQIKQTNKYKEPSIKKKLKNLKIKWKCLIIWCWIAWLINILFQLCVMK